MDEATATSLSQQGSASLKSEALARCQSWHSPIPDILHRTPETLVSGYPVFDRSMLTPEMLLSLKRVTLIGDAGHPMSPFKGQGANQALLDALQLARTLYSVNDGSCPLDTALQSFEREMLQRTAVKVEASAQAARFLHSDVAMQEGNVTRGAAAAASGRDSNA
jgi:salicylate hydroxylase